MMRLLGAIVLGAALAGAGANPLVAPEAVQNGFLDQTEPQAIPPWLDTQGPDEDVFAAPLELHPSRPHHPPPHRQVKKTIYEFLAEEKHFSKLTKLVNLNQATIDSLNDTSNNVTFFALPDWAFPHKRGDRKDHDNLDLVSSIPDAFSIADELDAMDDDDDDEEEKRKKWIKKIVAGVLRYNTLPEAFTRHGLAQNHTYATGLTLHDGSAGGQPLRVRVGTSLFSTRVNVISKIVHEVHTLNGVVHVVSFPVFPPMSIFQQLFLVEGLFSVASSALQRTGVSTALEWRYDREAEKVKGFPALTYFAPTNAAFERLPPKLRLFLFSPFGEGILGKLLKFHIVPDVIFHSNYVHNATAEEPSVADWAGMTAADFAQGVRAEGASVPEFLHPFEDMDTIPGSFFFGDNACMAQPVPRRRGMRGMLDKAVNALRAVPRVFMSFFFGKEPTPDLSFANDLFAGQLPEIPEIPSMPPMPHLPGSKRPSEEPTEPPHKGPHHPPRKCPHRRPPPHRCLPHKHPRHPHPHPPHHPRPHLPLESRHVHVLPTLLGGNHTARVVVSRYRTPHGGVRTTLEVNGVHVGFPDGVARNGAIHVVDRLFNPHRAHPPPPPPGSPPHREGGDEDVVEPAIVEGEHEWSGWEEWLLKWAEEN